MDEVIASVVKLNDPEGSTVWEVYYDLFKWPELPYSYSRVRYYLNKAAKLGLLTIGWAKWPTGCFARHSYKRID